MFYKNVKGHLTPYEMKKKGVC
ncbi:hypothetical protein EXIGUO8A_110203 [Exiguobacterium sp. 8A]|nr:hypothetical protein EXIGUO8A_110203 [Exiguobacterium sp. 8A]